MPRTGQAEDSRVNLNQNSEIKNKLGKMSHNSLKPHHSEEAMTEHSRKTLSQ